MARARLTVLTTPVPGSARSAYQGLRSRLRRVVRPRAAPPPGSPYPGHFALVRSAVEGLRAIEAEFNFNPRRFGEIADVVYAPANEALRQAAALKRSGRIRRLAAGPTNAFAPAEVNGILRLPEIDRLIVPSPWVVELYRTHAPELVPKMRVCPAGVDAGYWKPSATRRHGDVLLYCKDVDATFCRAIEEHVRRAGCSVQSINYGSYTREEYRRILDTCAVAVFLSTFETQGLALAEAWSMDVPTLVWDPQAPTEWRGFRFTAGSSAPYLTPATGAAWRQPAELIALLARERRPRSGQARAWVLAHMTDAVCARALHATLLDPDS
jgi:hypothetical protein